MSKFNEIAQRICRGMASETELRAMKIEDIVAIKSDGDLVHYVPPLCKSVKADAESRQLVDVVSDESTDRDGDVMLVKGWDMTDFVRNPVLMRFHNHQATPIGTVPQVRKGRANDAPALIATSQLFDNEDLDEEGQLIARLALKKLMPARSVGFKPIEVERPQDPAERKKLGLGEWGVLVKRASLVEVSIVNVGSNVNALSKCIDDMVREGLVTKLFADHVLKDQFPSSRVVVQIDGTKSFTPNAKSDESSGGSDLDALRVSVAAIEKGLVETREAIAVVQKTIGAELPALKGMLESMTRGGGAPSAAAEAAPQVPSEPPASTTKSAEVEVLSGTYASVLDAIDRTLATRKNHNPKG